MRIFVIFALGLTAFGAVMIGTASAQEISVHVLTDKPEYTFGDQVMISGNVSERVVTERPIFHVETVEITIQGPNYDNKFSLYPDSSLNYNADLPLYAATATKGTYAIMVEYAGATAMTEFTVSSVKNVPKRQDVAGQLSIISDRESYLPGQTVSLTARTTDIVEFAGLKFQVSDPDGRQVTGGTLYPDADGRFSTGIFLPSTSTSYGVHIVTAEYSDLRATSSFDVVKTLAAQSILLSTDKSAYKLGQTVEITGRLDASLPSIDVVIRQTDVLQPRTKLQPYEVTAPVMISSNGTFSHDYVIPDSPDRYGDYTITASTTVASSVATFQVVEDPDSHIQDDGSPLIVRADKDIYDIGSDFSISGLMTGASSASYTEPVEIRIKPDGNVRSDTGRAPPAEHSYTAILDETGRFTISDKLYSHLYNPGTFVIDATHPRINYKASDTFTVVDPLDIASKLKLSINKKVFGAGETVVVDGIAPGLEKGSGVDITLYWPGGDKDDFGALLDDSRFSWTWQTPAYGGASQEQTSTYGVYRAVFVTDSGRAEVFFKVSSDPENDSLDVPPIVVEIDKQVYVIGDILEVSGMVQKRQGQAIEPRVSVIVRDGEPPYGKIYDASIFPDIGGAFSTTFTLPVLVFENGLYNVIATYIGNNARADFTIDNEYQPADPPIQEPKPASRTTEKFDDISDNIIQIETIEKSQNDTKLLPRSVQGLLPVAKGQEASVNILVSSSNGTCIIGPDDCLVSESTRSPGQVYRTVNIDGVDYKIRYSGPDVLLERFAILPSDDGPISMSDWNVEILKDDQDSTFAYKVTYIVSK